MSLASRTRLAALLAAVSVGVAGVTTWAFGHGSGREPVAAGAVVRPSVTEGSALQVVAHPDDDLFFMNPDLSRSISTGIKVTTVYLTSGESDGRNEAHSPHLDDAAGPADRAAYAEARQNGIRGAYAQMATGDRTSAWQRRSIPTAGGGSAEVDVLVARPEVNLVWMQLREARSISGDNPDSLRGLWDGRIPALGAQLTSGTPVKDPFSYTKDQAIAAIADVFAQYKPTTIRTQDPTPGKTGGGAFLDHQDHMYGARFVQAAAERYARTTDRPHFSVQNYMSYQNSALPPTLDPQTAEEKLGYLKTYAWMDHDDWCGSPAGCGDRKTATRPTGAGWNQTIRYSRGDGTSWMTEGAAGRLWAFAVLDGRMAYWSRSGPKTAWQGPRFLPGTGIDAGATTVRLPDGRIAVFATRTTLGTTPQDYGRDLVYCVQDGADGAFGPWQSLGTPDPDTADTSVTSAISGPAVAVDPAGRMTVYVRDSRRTLRALTQTAPDGPFGAWQSLGGAGLLGDPVTATDGAGRRHVYAATTGSVLAWVEPTPGAPLAGAFATGLPQTTGVLSVRPEGDGARLFFRRPGTGTVGTSLATAGGPAPEFSPVAEAGGPGGYGGVGVAGPLLAGRTGSGTVGVVGAGGPESWQESQMLYTGAPAGVADRSGTAVAAALGLDADLHIVTTPAPAGTRPAGDPVPSPWHRAVQPPMLAQAGRDTR
ncbi:PIG-L family deacetylase [Streptomyces vinaceus]|uniref:PIG-L family deacetylase n=1 Tax=Streptomyces vinaceus TaxID=1960 RepID=A0A5J6JR87_STRVI|nr:PIG-L family deacetylase [Streptomyces vinaceus]QEV50226.1 PIG-L family deacetylase [Streptomyces vinaceus]GHE39502.1 hypothetical protein GCM10017778_23720 [Streptomyces vinaceus]